MTVGSFFACFGSRTEGASASLYQPQLASPSAVKYAVATSPKPAASVAYVSAETATQPPAGSTRTEAAKATGRDADRYHHSECTHGSACPGQGAPPCHCRSHGACACHQDGEAKALVHLRRELGALRGSWIVRANAALRGVAKLTQATDVSLWSADAADCEPSAPPCTFTMVLKHAADPSTGAAGAAADLMSSTASGYPCPHLGGQVGLSVEPVTTGHLNHSGGSGLAVSSSRGAGSVRDGSLHASAEALPHCGRCGLEALLATMLGRMLATQEAVLSTDIDGPPCAGSRREGLGAAAPPRGSTDSTCFDRIDSGSTGRGGCVAAVVPLSLGGRIVGALCIARHCDSASEPAGSNPILPATACAAELSAQPPAQPQQLPSVLTSAHALRELELTLSMCLLAGDGAEQLEALCGAVRALAAAGSMQHLLGALCDAAAAHVRRCFFLDPRVVAALVPEPSSPLGLLFSWDAAAAAAAAASASAASRTGAAASLPRSRNGVRRVVTASSAQLPSRLGSSSGMRHMATGSGGQGQGSAEMPVSRTSRLAAMLLPPAQPVPPEARPQQLDGAAHGERAEHASGSFPAAQLRSLEHPQMPQITISGVVGAGSERPRQSVDAGALGSGGPRSTGRGGRRLTAPMAATDVYDTAPGSLDTSALDGSSAQRRPNGGIGAGAGVSRWALLRAKPFPLANTLLRQVLGGAVAGAAGGNGGGDWTAVGVRALDRVAATLVEDCHAHLTDPMRPARDVLLLMAHSDAADASAPGNGGNGGDGSGAPGAAVPRRGVGSLVLLALPAGDGRGALGLYAAFPQPLPRPLLRQAREGLRELFQALLPLLASKLAGELALDLETLCSAAPGSYAVLEGAAAVAVAVAAPQTGGRRGSTSSIAESGLLTSTLSHMPASARALRSGPGPGQVGGSRGSLQPPLGKPAHDGGVAQASTASGDVGSITRASWFGSKIGRTGNAVGSAGGGGAGASRGNVRRAVTGDIIPSVTLPLSGSQRALGRPALSATQTVPAGAESRGHGPSVIVVEELDPVRSTLRSQVPLLVASLQGCIGSARTAVALAAAAAASAATGTPGSNRSPVAPSSSFRSGPAGASTELGDLALLELRERLGVGGCAVVFRARIGALECAVKVMDMPDAEQTDAEKARAGGNGSEAPAAAAAAGAEARYLSARRTLLRHAMEVATLTSVSHPNIIQVYSTFNNVTLAALPLPDGGKRLTLRPVEGAVEEADAPAAARRASEPVCMAIACEWCDRGCAATGLAKKLFHRAVASPVPPAPAAAPSDASGVLESGGEQAPNGRPQRVLDYRAVLLTLLDVALALRYLHAHNLVHRDIKAANVLLKTCPTDPRGFTAKLADFGFVAVLDQPGDERSGFEPFAFVDQSCGTVTHMAPESMRKPYRLDASCDMYSFGILMWEMTAGGSRPYRELLVDNVLRAVHTGVRPIFSSSVPTPYRLLAQRCWSAAPGQRPRSAELVVALSGLLASV